MSDRWDSVTKWMHSITQVSDHLSIKRVTEIMVDRNIGSVIVVSDKGEFGMVTERDIMSKVIVKGLDANTTLVKEIVSKPLVTIKEDNSIWDASIILSEHHMRRLPVENKKGEIIGILTTRSISDALPVISRFKESQALLSALRNMKHKE